MIKHWLSFLFFTALLAACHSTKITADPVASAPSSTAPDNNIKANLIDGTWEVNYILHTPKPFDQLYPDFKPTVIFNSAEGTVGGITGCNNFAGKFMLSGNQITWGEAMATTRKMCPDMSGEETFLTTLKMVNTYSVTEQGKTLNLIMGDMAIMRLTRIK